MLFVDRLLNSMTPLCKACLGGTSCCRTDLLGAGTSRRLLRSASGYIGMVWLCLAYQFSIASAQQFVPRTSLVPSTQHQDDYAPVITALAFQPQGELILSGGDDHQIRIWGLTDSQPRQTLSGHQDWVRGLAFSPDGAAWYSIADDGQLLQWTLHSAKPKKLLQTRSALAALTVSPDGTWVVTAGMDGSVHAIVPADRHRDWTIKLASPDIRALAVDPHSLRCAAAGRDGQVYLLDLASGDLITSFPTRGRCLHAVAFSLDGEVLVTGGDDRQLCLWDVSSGELVVSLHSGSAKVYALCSLGPGRIASAGSDNLIRIWDLWLRTEVTRGEAHRGSIMTLATDGQHLASGGFDAVLNLWSLSEDLGVKTAKKQDGTQDR